MTVRVSLDASAVPINPAGAGRYVLELASQLARRSDVELVVLSRRGDEHRWRRPGPAPAQAVAVVARAPRHRPLRLAWEQLRLPRALAGLPVDVHHGPHYTMPRAASLPRVVTVHDVSFLEHPEWHERAKVLFFRRAIHVAASHADALVAVSSTAAARLQAAVAPRPPVHVIPHGVDHVRYRPLDPSDHDGAAGDREALDRIGARPPYLAFVGTLEPRKDVPNLVRAFDRLAPAFPDLSLVLAGGHGWGAAAVEAAIGEAAHGSRVRLAGYVSEGEKVALLRSAAAVAYPSLDEGFGLPALEAMACGAPLVTTKGTAMEEVAGEAALLVPPGDVGQLTLALEALLAGGPDVSRRRQRGVEVAGSYTWERSAQAHVEVYRSVL